MDTINLSVGMKVIIKDKTVPEYSDNRHQIGTTLYIVQIKDREEFEREYLSILHLDRDKVVVACSMDKHSTGGNFYYNIDIEPCFEK